MKLRTHIMTVRAAAALLAAVLLFLLAASEPLGASFLAWAVLVLISAAVILCRLAASRTLACPACGRSYGWCILFRMGCPHCGAAVPHEARAARFCWIPTALLCALIAAAAVYCRPLSFPELTGGDITIKCIHYLPSVWDDDIGVGIPQSESFSADVRQGSAEAAAVQEILDGVSYHRCWETLTGAQSLSGGGEYLISISAGGRSLTLTGGEHIDIDGRVYHVGWFSGSAGERLTSGLFRLLWNDQTSF